MKKIVSLLFFGLMFFVAASGVNAQSLSLSPASASKTVGDEFSVDVNLDTAGKAVAAVDVKMTFDSDTIQITNVTKGDFFTDEAHSIGNGTLYVAGFFQEQFKTKTGTGKVATLTVKGISAGTDQLVFVCSPQTNDTNVLDASANDIVNCSATTNGTYTFSSGSSTAATSTPVPGAATATPTPPVSGIISPTVLTFGFGCLLTILGLSLLF